MPGLDDDMMKDWLRKHPDVRTIRVAAVDLNGQARGKRVPARFAENVVKNGTRFPFSVLNLDIWGEDWAGNPLVFQQGDVDGRCEPTGRGFENLDEFGTGTYPDEDLTVAQVLAGAAQPTVDATMEKISGEAIGGVENIPGKIFKGRADDFANTLAYRFFANPRVTCEDIKAPIAQA